MRENEELFRMAGERLRQQVAGSVTTTTASFPSCASARTSSATAGKVEMTLDDHRRVRLDENTFAVAPGRTAAVGEVVVQKYDSFRGAGGA